MKKAQTFALFIEREYAAFKFLENSFFAPATEATHKKMKRVNQFLYLIAAAVLAISAINFVIIISCSLGEHLFVNLVTPSAIVLFVIGIFFVRKALLFSIRKSIQEKQEELLQSENYPGWLVLTSMLRNELRKVADLEKPQSICDFVAALCQEIQSTHGDSVTKCLYLFEQVGITVTIESTRNERPSYVIRCESAATLFQKER